MVDSTLHADVAVLQRENKMLLEEVKALRLDLASVRQQMASAHDVKELSRELAEMRQQANRWRGGLAVVLGLGGFLTVFITLYEKLGNLFK